MTSAKPLTVEPYCSCLLCSYEGAPSFQLHGTPCCPKCRGAVQMFYPVPPIAAEAVCDNRVEVTENGSIHRSTRSVMLASMSVNDEALNKASVKASNEPDHKDDFSVLILLIGMATCGAFIFMGFLIWWFR